MVEYHKPSIFSCRKNKPFYDSLTFESYTIHLWINVQSYFSVTSVTLLLCVWSFKFFKIDQMAFQIKSKESILNVFQSLRTVTYCICNLKVDTCEVRSQAENATKWVTISIIDNLAEQRRASKRELRLGSTSASDEDLVWVVCKCFWMCGGSFTHFHTFFNYTAECLETIRNKNTTFSLTSKCSNVLLTLRKFRKHYFYKCNALESNYGMFKWMHNLITNILNTCKLFKLISMFL